MPLSLVWKIVSKLCLSVSVKTNEPATNAVPRSTEISVSASRTLCAARLRRATVLIVVIGSPFRTGSSCAWWAMTDGAQEDRGGGRDGRGSSCAWWAMTDGAQEDRGG